MEPASKKLLDRGRDAIRLKHYSIRTENTYVESFNRTAGQPLASHLET